MWRWEIKHKVQPTATDTWKQRKVYHTSWGNSRNVYFQKCLLNNRDKKLNIRYERIFTGLALLACLAGAGIFASSAWIKFSTSPIVVNVESTFYPLYLLPFPAVTICPASFVKTTIGEQLLLKYLNVSWNQNLHNDLWNIMSALSSCQFPFYKRMKTYLKPVNHLLTLFDGFNITDFMLQVLPTCKELFGECFWLGQRFNCCEMFNLQRSEAGFCYSFNSMASEDTMLCSVHDEFSEVISFKRKIKERNESMECEIRHNTASGTTTGLEVFLKHSKPEESLGLMTPGAWVIIHRSIQYPEVGEKIFMPEKENSVSHIEITPYMTESSPDIRALSIDQRKCFFSDETKLSIFHTYTEENCVMECRLKYASDKCGCYPYFFSNLSPGQLKINKPPEGILGFDDLKAIDCSHCLPTCQDIRRSQDYIYSSDNHPRSANYAIYLDVYYKETGAVKYHQYIAFDFMDLVVSFGGVVSLFLGVSMINILQFLYKCVNLYHQCHIQTRRPQIKPSITYLN